MDCQLAYSLNGWHFQRGLRDPFIPNGPPGDPDSGTVYPSCMVPQEDGSLRLYASACTLEHGNVQAGDAGSLLAYSMRRDGFMYLESTGGRGTVGTRALYWRGGEAQLNVQGPGRGGPRPALRRGPHLRGCPSPLRDVTPWRATPSTTASPSPETTPLGRQRGRAARHSPRWPDRRCGWRSGSIAPGFMRSAATSSRCWGASG